DPRQRLRRRHVQQGAGAGRDGGSVRREAGGEPPRRAHRQPGARQDRQGRGRGAGVAAAAAAHQHVLLDLLRDDRPARPARAVRHLRLHLAAVARHEGPLLGGLLRTGRLLGAVLAPGRPDLDLPLPPALSDPLRRAPWRTRTTITTTTTTTPTTTPTT